MNIFKNTSKNNTYTKPVYKMLKVKDLKLAAYQHPLKERNVKEWAQNFDYDIFGMPLVSYRDGQYWIVDGQHRVALLKMLGEEEVLCQVLTGLNYEEEADKFVKLNTQRGQLSAPEKFHGRVEKRDKIAMHIVDILNDNGLTYAKTTGARSVNEVGCVACVQDIFKTRGINNLNRTLNTVKQLWYGVPESLTRDIINGVSLFYSSSRGVDDDILVCALKSYSPQGLIAKSLSIREGSSCTDRTKYLFVAKFVREKYYETKRMKR